MEEPTHNSPPGQTQTAIDPLVQRRFAMVFTFLRSALEALDDPVFGQIKARDPVPVDKSGKPLPPDALVERMRTLDPSRSAQLLSFCCVAATNIGYAYEHVFRLIYDLEKRAHAASFSTRRSGLADLYDALSKEIRNELEGVYRSIESHEFEIEEAFGKGAEWPKEDISDSEPRSLRQTLRYWETSGLLSAAHYKYSRSKPPFAVRVLMPLRSVEFVDRILSEVLAPKLGLNYTRITGETQIQESPKVEWKEGAFLVSLPDKRGRIIEARWRPAITSVVRIRPAGSQEWSVGFETPLTGCAFVGLNPDTEYEVQLTSKNDFGESEPKISTFRTGSDSPRRKSG